MRSSARVIVTGAIAQYPMGGMTWHYLQYVLGLARLGHEVYYFEDTGAGSYDPARGGVVEECDFSVRYLAGVMSRFGLGTRWAYRFGPGGKWYGLSDPRRRELLRSADLLINVSGVLERPGDYRGVRRLAYVDTDPVFNQVKLLLRNAAFAGLVDAHDVHFTFGEGVTALMRSTTHRWRPTRQPVVLSEWEGTGRPREVFTTVMNWSASKHPPVYEGVTYGQKDVEFERFLDLPERCDAEFEVVMNAGKRRAAPVDLIRSKGWRVLDAERACVDPNEYRDYVRSSMGEWSVAKNGYVRGRPGWFSERSACYLAAGRPVVVQDTGIDPVLPVGTGIRTFTDLDGAVDAIRDVRGTYARESRAAREIAEAYFDSDKVLARLVQESTDGVEAYRAGTREGAPFAGSRDGRNGGRADSSKTVVLEGVGEHPAVRAWKTLHPGGSQGIRVDLLKGRNATARRSAYRLTGAGPGDASVIAKRYPPAKAAVERWLYEEVLPRVRVSTPRFYGWAHEGDGSSCWLFLEDVGEQRYCASDEEHRRLAGRWLGRLHTAVLPEQSCLRSGLEDVGPACWLIHAKSGRRRIDGGMGNSALSAGDREVLGEVAELLEAVEEGWDRIEGRCEGMPRTLVHGDFVAKNIGVRRQEGGGDVLLPYDWGQAGWGPPAVDLGTCPPGLGGLTADVDVAAYWETVRGHWKDVDRCAVQDWATVGTLARCLTAINWEAASLGSAYVTESVVRMGLYRDALGEVLKAGEFA